MKEHTEAKVCFSHIGGTLGRILLESFAAKKWFVKINTSEKHYIITEKGER